MGHRAEEGGQGLVAGQAWRRAGAGRGLTALSVPGALVAGLLLVACGDEVGEAVQATRESSRMALAAGDPSQALSVARAHLHEHGPSPAVLLEAATACIALDRYDEALEYATEGRGLADEGEVSADLAWAEGKARLGRFRDLGRAADWDMANILLEEATGAGSHRAEAASLLVLIQEPAMGGKGDTRRQRKFLDRLAAIDPGSDQLPRLRALVDGKDGGP